jgi:hypothetical protein
MAIEKIRNTNFRPACALIAAAVTAKALVPTETPK